MNLTEIPVQFGRVDGYFDCAGNKLTTLKGAPTIVGGFFGCNNNVLTSLEGGPQLVGGYYACSFNKLTNLIGAPGVCNDDFFCRVNKLTSLEGCPFLIKKDLYVSDNLLSIMYGLGIICHDIHHDISIDFLDINSWIRSNTTSTKNVSAKDIAQLIHTQDKYNIMGKAYIPNKIREYLCEFKLDLYRYRIC